jgi:hypothetical protein
LIHRVKYVKYYDCYCKLNREGLFFTTIKNTDIVRRL